VSFLEWADKLPAGWEAKPLRSTVDYVVSNVDKVPVEDEVPVRLCNYTDVYNNEFITLALDFMQATASEKEIAKFGLRVNDVAITKDSESWDDIGVPALVRETASDLVCGYHLALLRPHQQKMEGAFLFRCLQAKPVRVQLELAANGVTRFGIPKSEIGAMTLPVPSLQQQRSIADYLDRETARLDALVAAKERVLRLLAEKRRALITRAVTRGLDPRAPLRDSGIPWLGEIPAHWTSTRLRFLGRFKGGAGFPHEDQGLRDEALPFFKVKDLSQSDQGFVLIDTDNSISFSTAARLRAFVFPAGTIVFAKVGAALLLSRFRVLGSTACIDNNMMGFMVHEAVVDRDFALTIMRLVNFSEVVNPGAVPSLNEEQIGDQPVALPPLREQREILARLSTATTELDAVRLCTEHTIALLKERRAALIAAAVTGQIDVGEFAA